MKNISNISYTRTTSSPEKQKRWLEINTRNFVSSIFENGSDKTQEYYDVLEKIYRKAMEPGSSLTQPAMAMLSQLIKYIG